MNHLDHIRGVIAPNLTFFHRDGSVDEAMSSQHMDWILDNGINGLFVTGTYGSGYLMTLEQRTQVYRLARQSSDRHPGSFVIAHVGANDTASSVELTRAAVGCGADAISAIAPYNFKYTEAELLAYYQALIDAADSVPVFAYNNPSITGQPIKFSTVKKLQALGIAALKDSSIDMQLVSSIYADNRLNQKDFKYISGTTTGWLTFRKLGVDTMIAGMCNYVPELVSRFYRLSLEEDDIPALKASRILEDLSSVVKVGNSLLSCHLALQARGWDPGYMKAPLSGDWDRYADLQPAIKDAICRAVVDMARL